MNSTSLPAIVFAAVSLLVTAVLLLLRDLFFPRPTVVEERLLTGERGLKRFRGKGGPVGRLTLESTIPMTMSGVLSWAVILASIAGAAAFAWREQLLAAAAAAIIALLATATVLAYLRSRRRWAILEQLPHVTEYLSRAVRGGDSLDQGIHRVGESNYRPLAAEFRRCARQLEMGLSFDFAMQVLTRRIPLVESRVLAATLRVQRHTGGNLSLTLERLAGVFRERLSYRRQFRALTATSMSSVVLIVVLSLAVDAYALIWQPQFAREVLTTTPGQVLGSIALVLQVVGILWAYAALATD